MHSLEYVDAAQLTKLESAVGKLKLELWLYENDVGETLNAFTEIGVNSMKDLCEINSDKKMEVFRCIA